MRREKAIRIGIAQDGIQLSAVWRFWLQGSDVYAASRNIAGKIKTSLHRSGKFRHAFVTADMSLLDTKRTRGLDSHPRKSVQWSRAGRHARREGGVAFRDVPGRSFA
jgi:hypothetical protein